MAATLKGPKGNSSDHERVVTVSYPFKQLKKDVDDWFRGPHAVLMLTGLPSEAVQHEAQLKVLDSSLWEGLNWLPVQQEPQIVEGTRTLRVVKDDACMLAALLALRRTKLSAAVTRKVLAPLRQLWQQQSKDMQRRAGIGQCLRCGRGDYIMREGPPRKQELCRGCVMWVEDQMYADELGIGECICDGDAVYADCPRCSVFGDEW